MSNAPLQVQRAADEAARRQQELIGNLESPAGTNAEVTPPAAPPPSDPPAAPTVSVEALQAELAKADQRYRSLQGVFDAERHRFLDRIDGLSRTVENLTVAPPTAPAAPAPTAPASSKDLEDFGQDTIDLIGRIARAVATEVVTKAIEPLTQRLAPVVQQVEEVQTRVMRSAEQDFFDNLVELVPDWEAVNADSRFGQWLSTADALTGIPYQTLLNDARQRLDVRRVTAVFLKFKEAAGIVTPKPGASQRQVADEREAMIEPARRSAGSGRPAGSSEKRRWTRAEISAFFRDVSAGRIGRSEAAALESDIMLAQSEGRIVG